MLIEQHRSANLAGRIALSVLLFQDLMVVPILFVVDILAGGEKGGIGALIEPFAAALAAVIAIMLVGRFVVRPLLRSAVRTGSRDLIMAITLLILVVFAVATGLAGLSVALGAFLAGLLLSDSEVRHHIEVDLEPFKGLLLGIFFISVGTNVDIVAIAGDAGWIVLAVVAADERQGGDPVRRRAQLRRAARSRRRSGAAAGAGRRIRLRGDRGGAGRQPAAAAACRRRGGGGGPEHAGDAAGGDRGAPSSRPGWRPPTTASHAPGPELAELDNHVVIGGFGRVGRLIARTLEAENVPYVGLDSNGELVGRMRIEHRPVFFGDAGRPELLTRIGAQRARAFVVTVNNSLAAERMVAAAKQINPRAVVFARASDPAHAERLIALGAVSVIPETVEASLQLVARLLERLDLPEEAISQRVADMRAAELGRLAEGTAGG